MLCAALPGLAQKEKQKREKIRPLKFGKYPFSSNASF